MLCSPSRPTGDIFTSDEGMPILDSCYTESPDYVYFHELDIKQSFINLETGILLGKGCFCMKEVLQTSPPPSPLISQCHPFKLQY